MLTKIFTVIAVHLLLLTCHAQLPSKRDLFNYEKNSFHIARNEGGPFLIVVTPNKIKYYSRDFNQLLHYFTSFNKLADSLHNDPNFRINHPYNKIVQNFDSAKALVFVQGVNRKNAAEYEYRIFENNKTTTTWNAFNTFYPAIYVSGFGEGDPEMAAIGYVGTTWNNYLTIDVRRKNKDSIISSGSIIWMPHPPKVIATFAPNEFNRFLSVFKIRSVIESASIHNYEPPMEDSLLITRREFASTENNIIFYLDDIIKQKIVEYQLQGSGEESQWKLNELDFNSIWLKDLKPGKYKLRIRYSTQRHNVTEYDFEIKPAWQQTTWFKIISGSLVAAFFGFIITLVRTRGQQQKMVKKGLEKEKIEMELKAIRSQLNPHFVYNSLNSIQNLVNKSDIPNANKYLSQFSKLMRETLSTSDRKFNSIGNEIKVLETYLGLEQLRFNFKFEIDASPEVNAEITEIPSLLLQPLVENAVKHGVEALKEKGFIRIQFFREKEDLLILVFDNGKGFTVKANNGYGLKMTADRISLLNRTLPDQLIELDMKNTAEGTTLHLLFKNWFI